MSDVDRLPNGRYKARYRGPDRRQRSKTFARKGDAERFLATVSTDAQRGEWVDPSLTRMSFAAWVAGWKATTLHLGAGTRAIHDRELPELLRYFGTIQLGSITSMAIRSWMAEQQADGVGASRINRRYRLLRQMLNVAVQTDHLGKNPCLGAKPPSLPHREMRFLTPEEVSALGQEISPWYRVWPYFAAYSGLRWAETLGVRRMDLDLVHRRVQVVQQITEVKGQILPPTPPKTHAGRRSLDLPAALCEMLDEQLAERAQPGPSGLVFVNSVGKTPHASSFASQVWGRARRRTGLEGVRWHDLRHTAVAMAIKQGAHPNAIKERMGHSSITVTLDRYGHLFPSLGKDLAAGLDQELRASMSRSAAARVIPIRPAPS